MLQCFQFDLVNTAIPPKYVADAKNQKQAVIVDLETFNRMESIIEDNGLFKIHGRSRRG